MSLKLRAEGTKEVQNGTAAVCALSACRRFHRCYPRLMPFSAVTIAPATPTVDTTCRHCPPPAGVVLGDIFRKPNARVADATPPSTCYLPVLMFVDRYPVLARLRTAAKDAAFGIR